MKYGTCFPCYFQCVGYSVRMAVLRWRQTVLTAAVLLVSLVTTAALTLMNVTACNVKMELLA